MFRHDWPVLATFFSDLAESWRGWVGEKVWRSTEHDLDIVAVPADSLGHCSLSFIVRAGWWDERANARRMGDPGQWSNHRRRRGHGGPGPTSVDVGPRACRLDVRGW